MLELVKGASLHELNASRASLGSRLSLLRDACLGASAVHESNAVHGDLRPCNILVAEEGHGTLTDFGSAQWVGRSPELKMAVVGTTDHMSPEQVRGGSLDCRSDIFSLGIVLFEILTGENPFTTGNIASRRSSIMPPELPWLSGNHAERFQTVAEHALARLPEERFGSASEMADAMAPLIDSARSLPATFRFDVAHR